MGKYHCLCYIDFLTNAKVKAISKGWVSFPVFISAESLTIPTMQDCCDVNDGIIKMLSML